MADILTRVSQTTNKKSYQARVRRTGYPTLTRTFESKAAASAWAREQEKNILDGAPILTKDKERFTFAVAIEDYEKHCVYDSPTEKYRFHQIKEDMAELDSDKFSRRFKQFLLPAAVLTAPLPSQSISPSRASYARNS
jgi:hypothetical protein